MDKYVIEYDPQYDRFYSYRVYPNKRVLVVNASGDTLDECETNLKKVVARGTEPKVVKTLEL